MRSDRATGAGELVKFGQPVWYRFSFKISGDWPRDVPAAGRHLCRTVIHQIKQDSFKSGKSSPRIERRESSCPTALREPAARSRRRGDTSAWTLAGVRFAPDSLLEEGVTSEPVSVRGSLVTG